MEYYSAIKNNETMPVAATWMDLVILNEVRQRKSTSGTQANSVGEPAQPLIL